MQKPLSDLYIRPKDLALLQSLLAQYLPDCEVWAYGSRVNGGAHEGSDLDLAVHNVQDFSAYLDCIEAYRESRIPFLIDWHIFENLPERFQANIRQGYMVIQPNAT